jgi:protein TonB
MRACALVIHAAAVTVAVGWGLCQVGELPAPMRPLIVYLPKPPPTAAAGSPGQANSPRSHTRSHQTVVRVPTIKTVEPQPISPPAVSATGEDVGGSGPSGEGDPEGGGGCTGPNCGSCAGPGCGPATSTPETRPTPVTVTESAAIRVAGESPEYPAAARLAGVQGTVVAKICTNAEGDVTSVSLLKSLPGLDDTVRRAASRWRYQPYRVNGTRIPICIIANFQFHIEK